MSLVWPPDWICLWTPWLEAFLLCYQWLRSPGGSPANKVQQPLEFSKEQEPGKAFFPSREVSSESSSKPSGKADCSVKQHVQVISSWLVESLAIIPVSESHHWPSSQRRIKGATRQCRVSGHWLWREDIVGGKKQSTFQPPAHLFLHPWRHLCIFFAPRVGERRERAIWGRQLLQDIPLTLWCHDITISDVMTSRTMPGNTEKPQYASSGRHPASRSHTNPCVMLHTFKVKEVKRLPVNTWAGWPWEYAASTWKRREQFLFFTWISCGALELLQNIASGHLCQAVLFKDTVYLLSCSHTLVMQKITFLMLTEKNSWKNKYSVHLVKASQDPANKNWNTWNVLDEAPIAFC